MKEVKCNLVVELCETYLLLRDTRRALDQSRFGFHDVMIHCNIYCEVASIRRDEKLKN